MDSSRNIIKKLRENRLLAERKDYENTSTEELIKMAQDGDQYAYQVLIDKHQDFLRRMTSKYFLHYNGDRDDVMQIAQIAFANAIAGWDGNGEFEAYAGMLIKRALTDAVRAEDTEKAVFNSGSDSLDQEVTANGDETKTLGDVVPAKDPTPEEQYMDNENVRKIMQFMEDNLSEKELKVIQLVIDGWKGNKDIAEELGMGVKAVENTKRRVKEKLADYLNSVKESLGRGKESLDEEIEFTDIEKKILSSAFKMMDESVNESVSDDIDYEDEIEVIKSKAEELISKIGTVTEDEDYEDLLDEIPRLEKSLYELSNQIEADESIDDDTWDYLSDLIEDAKDTIYRAEKTDPENLKPEDPYASRGLSRSDFF